MPERISFFFWSITKLTPNRGMYNRISPNLLTSHLCQGNQKNQTNQNKV